MSELKDEIKKILSEKQQEPKRHRAKGYGETFTDFFFFSKANKNRGEHLVNTSVSSDAPTDIKHQI